MWLGCSVREDSPMERTVPAFVAGMNRFTRDLGLAARDAAYNDVVASQFSALWRSPAAAE